MSWVDVERSGDVVWARLNHPDRANALAPEMVEILRDVVDSLSEDTSVRALVLTGTGRAFCAGADVRASAELGQTSWRLEFIDSGRRLVDSLANAPVPVIAAVNGAAFAGGLELVLACDLVVAADTAVFGDLHVEHGRIPGWGSTGRLMAAVGTHRATAMLLMGERWTAARAAEYGLVNLVVAGDALPKAVDEMLGRLGSAEPRVVRQMIALLRDLRRRASAESSAVEWKHFIEHFSVDDPGVIGSAGLRAAAAFDARDDARDDTRDDARDEVSGPTAAG